MTTFLLLRHAAHDNVGGFLAGRMPGVRLGEAGIAQARRLGERLRRERVALLYCSPRERARETADALAACGLPPPQVVEALDEVDFGAWSGSSFDKLSKDPAWRAWNERRSLARTPNGERMIDVQGRVLAALEQMARAAQNATVAVVTHADIIKAAVMYHLALRVDDWWRIDVSPASITRLVVDDNGARLVVLNELVD